MSKDSVTSHLEKSIISSIISNARASLKEPSRPFTPSEVQRSLFTSSDRPGSSYSIKSLSKDLQPLKPKQVLLDAPIQTKRRVMSEENKSESRQPVKALAVEISNTKEFLENEDLNQLKNLIFLLDQMKIHSEARQLYQKEDLQELLNEISSVLQKLKYLENKPAWAAVEEVMKNLALTLERFEKEVEKVMIIGKCLLDNITAHEVLYLKGRKGLNVHPLASASLKVLYQFSKKNENDFVFWNEKVVDTLYVLLINIVSEDTFLEVDLPYEFLIFLLGILKNITNNDEISRNCCNFVNPLAALLPTPLIDTKPHRNPKHGNLLVQVAGILSNLSGKVDTQELLLCQVIEKMTIILDLYKDPELILNSIKIISKISLHPAVCAALSSFTEIYMRVLITQENPLFLSRVCFIVANILTLQESSRESSDPGWIPRLCEIISKSLQIQDPIHLDLSLKAVRLIANIISHPSIGVKTESPDFLCKLLVEILSTFSLESQEELVLNTVACLTNLLYFDLPGKDFLTSEMRMTAFSKLPPMLVSSFNEEVTMETLRALGNLTRHEEIVKELPGMYMTEIFLMILDHSNYSVLFYDLGCLINVSSLCKEIIYCEKYFFALVELLENTFLYELDITNQILMVLVNLCTHSKGVVPWESVAGDEGVKKLNAVVKNLALEAKDVNSDEKDFVKFLALLRSIEKLMPKPLIPCTFDGCGRKFANEELLKDHWTRRHN
jgi:hypothetical protein